MLFFLFVLSFCTTLANMFDSDLFHFFNSISPLSRKSFSELSVLFNKRKYQAGDFFESYGQYAKKIGFLESGIVRAFFTNEKVSITINSFCWSLFNRRL